MPALRICKTSNYTVVSNRILWDKRISLKARGLLIFCLGLPDGWEYSIEGLVKATGEGKTSIASGLKELEENGYLRRRRVYTKGKVSGIEYFLYEDPMMPDIAGEPVEEEIPFNDFEAVSAEEVDFTTAIPVDIPMEDESFNVFANTTGVMLPVENLKSENLNLENLILEDEKDNLVEENLKSENLILENPPQYNTNTLVNTNNLDNTNDLVNTKDKKKNINKKRKKKTSDDEKEQEEKLSYAEFVKLKPSEYKKLINDERLGNEEAVNACIDMLNDFKGANGKKYSSDYYAIRRWVIDAYLNRKPNNTVVKSTGKLTVAEAADAVRERLKGMKLNGLR